MALLIPLQQMGSIDSGSYVRAAKGTLSIILTVPFIDAHDCQYCSHDCGWHCLRLDLVQDTV